jgi:hypothetical protein
MRMERLRKILTEVESEAGMSEAVCAAEAPGVGGWTIEISVSGEHGEDKSCCDGTNW